jgi:putative phosphoesterase
VIGTRRIAVFADVHGNPIALDAVLEDIAAAGGADETWVLGDLAALGHDPVGALERLAALPNAFFVRGNTDRHVVEAVPVGDVVRVMDSAPERTRELIETVAGFSWTTGAVHQGGFFEWMADLPLERRTQLPDGTQVLCVHAAPGTDDGHGLHPNLSDSGLADLVGPSGANLILTGHTHWPMDRTVDGVRAVNVGSVSNPMAPGLRASYVVLDADKSGYRVRNVEVSYDRDAVIRALRASNCPSAEYVESFMRGERTPHWMR